MNSDAKDLTKAFDATEDVYSNLKEIAADMFDVWASDVNALVASVSDVNSLSLDQIRDLIFKLAVKCFSFSETKERAAMKREIAETLRKEAYAKAYSTAQGAVAARDTQAQLATSAETAAAMVYDLVANLFKIKLDECRRLIDSLKTILTTRLAEAKLNAESSPLN